MNWSIASPGCGQLVSDAKAAFTKTFFVASKDNNSTLVPPNSSLFRRFAAVPCISRDCPIFYMRKKVQKELKDATAMLDRLVLSIEQYLRCFPLLYFPSTHLVRFDISW